MDKKVLSSLPQEIAWYWHVARTGYDLVVDFQQLPRCRWVVAFSGAPVRLSYTPPWYTRLLYTHSSDMLDGYSAMSKASVLRPLGIEWNGERPRVYLTDEEHAFARTLLAQAGLQPEQRLITLDPTHRQPTRRWPLAHYAGLVSLLAERDASLRFLPLWGPGEEAEIQELSRLCPAGSLLLPERMLSLREMAACIAEADLHIGNCSAPRHIAVAVDTPTLTVLGSTTPAWTFPSPEHADIALNLPCQHCNRNHCPDPRCLTGMLPGPVADKAVICGGIIAFVAVVCVIFLVRAYRAGQALGMDTTKMKRTIISSATFSLLPSVGILLGVIALSGSLGTPWPWLRLSVIGALHYETQVAQAAAEQVGMSTLSAAEMTPQAFSTIALLMSICIIWGMTLSIFLNKKYTQKLTSNKKSDKPGFGDMAMTAMFIGLVSTYIGRYLGGFISENGLFTLNGDYIPLVVMAVSALVMAGFVYLIEKKGKAWVDSFSIAGSMIIGMTAAVLVGLL